MFETLSLFFDIVRVVLFLGAQLLVGVIMTGVGLVLCVGGRFEGLIPLAIGGFALFNFGKSLISYFD
ncbi:MAG: hypothetical protein AAFO63_06000 [Pseudomonadota bacterium]